VLRGRISGSSRSPVEVSGADTFHAPFLSERRTRGSVPVLRGRISGSSRSPVEVSGADTFHAPFLSERRTRGSVPVLRGRISGSSRSPTEVSGADTFHAPFLNEGAHANLSRCCVAGYRDYAFPLRSLVKWANSRSTQAKPARRNGFWIIVLSGRGTKHSSQRKPCSFRT
jgi:hypothetical protein